MMDRQELVKGNAELAQQYIQKVGADHSGKGVLNEPVLPPEELQCSSECAVMILKSRHVQQRHLDPGIRASKVLL